MNRNSLIKIARKTVEKTISEFDDELRIQAESIPVLFLGRPDKNLADDGDFDLLGLFTGPNYEQQWQLNGDIPPRIVIFVSNIYDDVDMSMNEFSEQVKITYLHELGHFLGLDENELHKRDLD